MKYYTQIMTVSDTSDNTGERDTGERDWGGNRWG